MFSPGYSSVNNKGLHVQLVTRREWTPNDTSDRPVEEADSQASGSKTVPIDVNNDCCGICLETFISPRILPCKHIFCRLCLIKLADKSEREEPRIPDTDSTHVVFECPMCRAVIKLLKDGIDKLPMYFEDDVSDKDNTRDVVDVTSKNDVRDVVDVSDEDDASDLCVVCENNIPAEYECFQCQKVFCESCKKFHDNFLKHEVQVLKIILQQDKCVTHPEVKHEYVCQDCCSTLCKECVKSDHSTHQTLTLKSFLMKWDGKVENYSSQIQTKIEKVEISKALFFTKIESKVFNNIKAVNKLGEDFKIEMEKACQGEKDNQHKDKTFLKRINSVGKKIKMTKRKKKFNQQLISEIVQLSSKIDTHKIFYLPNKVDSIIDNQIGKMDIQMGRLFEFQVKENKEEKNVFFGNINWTFFFESNARNYDREFCITLSPFIKPEDTLLIESISTKLTCSVDVGGDIEKVLKEVSKTFISEKDKVILKFTRPLNLNHDRNKNPYSVRVLFQETNIKCRMQLD